MPPDCVLASAEVIAEPAIRLEVATNVWRLVFALDVEHSPGELRELASIIAQIADVGYESALAALVAAVDSAMADIR